MHPVSLEGPVPVSQEPKPRSAQQPGFLAEFATGGIHHPLSGFDCDHGMWWRRSGLSQSKRSLHASTARDRGSLDLVADGRSLSPSLQPKPTPL